MKVIERSDIMKNLTPKKILILIEILAIIGIVVFSVVNTYKNMYYKTKQDVFVKVEDISLEDNEHKYRENEIVAFEKLSDYEKAFINTYLKLIEAAAHEFYSEYYTELPTISYYYVRVTKLQSNQVLNPTIYITFRVSPYLGAYNVIGEDEITFSANYVGEIALVEYQHITTYDLPENMKDLIKKKLPDQ